MKEIKSQNMSIKKHHEMLKFLSDNSTYFNSYNPNPKFIRKVTEIENSLRDINYGLNFGDYREEVENLIEDIHIYILKNKNLSIDGTGNKYILIEGEKFA